MILTNISQVCDQHTVPLHHLQYYLSGNTEMSKPWNDGSIWSGSGAEAATRVKDFCHRRARIQGKPGFHSLSWTHFFFQAMAMQVNKRRVAKGFVKEEEQEGEWGSWSSPGLLAA